jgi:putative hydrolase of the HAD superfamily
LFQTYRETFYKNIKVEKSTINLLKYLKKKGIEIGIITDSQLYSQLKKMEILGISEYIDVFVSSEEAGAEKPQSSPFLLAIHKLKVLAEECIMVGDSISRDIE